MRFLGGVTSTHARPTRTLLRDFRQGAPADLVTRKVAALLWGVPLAALLMASFMNLDAATRTPIWTISLLWAGGACVLNAWRSGRLHCHLTGPYFIALAGLGFVHGSGVVSLGPDGWTFLGALLVVGAPLLTFIPEWVFGKYAKRTGQDCC
jgi:hypothetical protein